MHIPLRRINDVLLIAIILINGYIMVAPLIPKVTYWWQRNHGNHYEQLTRAIQQTSSRPNKTSSNLDVQNQLIAPDMLINTPILEAPVRDTYKVLDQGIWRWPKGSTPDKGGNTILIGHRFTYTNPRGIFYNMDKVHVGDEMGLRWSEVTYRYKVTSVSTTSPNNTSILDATDDARLTMYTCTPTWNPKDRLVVVAELETNG